MQLIALDASLADYTAVQVRGDARVALMFVKCILAKESVKVVPGSLRVC